MNKNQRWINLAVLALVSLAGMMAVVGAFQVPGPIIGKLGITGEQFGYFMTTYLVAFFLSALFVGKIEDSIGLKNGMLVAFPIVVIALVIFTNAGSYVMALAGRFILGVGTCFWFTAAPGILGIWAPPNELPIHQGVYFGFQFFGTGLAGLIIYDLMVTLGSWENAIYVTAVLAVIAWIAVAAFLKGVPEKEKGGA